MGRVVGEPAELVVDNHASKRIKDGHAALPLAELKKLTCLIHASGKGHGRFGRWLIGRLIR